MSHLIWYPGHELLLPDIVRAENCHLYDSEGKRYVDLESGVWCTSLGHGHPRVRRVLAEQAARIAHTGFGYSNATVEGATREILALLGLEGIQARSGRIGEIRARGLMVALELQDDAQASLTIRTHRELARWGYVVGRRPGVSVLRLDPALTVEGEDMEAP
jgi:4-aminobutyrate aminotransferase-like enzyme